MRVLICGDSWGCGEWGWDSSKKYCVTHSGLQYYFERDGHEVINLSAPSKCNMFSYNRILQYLSIDDNFDHIIWFKTDPLRDLDDELIKQYSSFDDLMNSKIDMETKAYSAFNELGKRIECIGGAGKLNPDLISSYSNLNPLIVGITELLLDEYEHPDLWASDWIFLIDRQFDLDSIDKLLIQKQKQDQLVEIEKYRKYFWPDGYHPNRHAWKIIYEYVLEKIKSTK